MKPNLTFGSGKTQKICELYVSWLPASRIVLHG